MWYQQSRLNWFQAGDLNTRFFHARASSCYKKNIIAGLTDPNGIWHEEEHKIEEILIRHYKDLFYSTRPSKFIELLAAIQPKASEPMNQMLNRTFQGSEMYSALKQMYPMKSLGPDSMPLFSSNISSLPLGIWSLKQYKIS